MKDNFFLKKNRFCKTKEFIFILALMNFWDDLTETLIEGVITVDFFLVGGEVVRRGNDLIIYL